MAEIENEYLPQDCDKCGFSIFHLLNTSKCTFKLIYLQIFFSAAEKIRNTDISQNIMFLIRFNLARLIINMHTYVKNKKNFFLQTKKDLLMKLIGKYNKSLLLYPRQTTTCVSKQTKKKLLCGMQHYDTQTVFNKIIPKIYNFDFYNGKLGLCS